MHINWLTVAIIAYGAFSTFVSFLPAPDKPGAPVHWLYSPLFHVAQYLAFNPGRSVGILKSQNSQEHQ